MTREDLINQRATTCRHGGHCEWVACDKCNHYEPTSETITNSTSGYLEVVLSECEDCISRQAVLNTLDKMDKALDTDRTVESYKKLLTECYKDLPSVTPKEKTGWHIAHGMYEDRFWCSCGYIKVMDSNMIEWKYCPLCGGERMQKVEK